MTEPFGLAEMRSLMAELRAQYRPPTPTVMPASNTMWVPAEKLTTAMRLVSRGRHDVKYQAITSVVVGSKFFGSRGNLPKNPECVHVNGSLCFSRGQLVEVSREKS